MASASHDVPAIACIQPSLHFPRRDGQTELTWVSNNKLGINIGGIRLRLTMLCVHTVSFTITVLLQAKLVSFKCVTNEFCLFCSVVS